MYSGKTIAVTLLLCLVKMLVCVRLQRCSDSNWQLALSLKIIEKCAFHNKFFQCNILGDSKYVSLWWEISAHTVGLCCFMEWEQWLIWLQFNQSSVNVSLWNFIRSCHTYNLINGHAQSLISKLFSIVNDWPDLVVHHFAACVVICISKECAVLSFQSGIIYRCFLYDAMK